MLYILKGEIYRKKEKTDETVKIYKEFRNDNLIIAREECFSSYQSYIDVFLEGIGKQYHSHNQAASDLKNFIDSGKKKTKLGLPYTDFGMGISISFVPYDTIEYQNNHVKIGNKTERVIIYKDEFTIHGLEYSKGINLSDIYLKNLRIEIDFYKKNNLEIRNELNGLAKVIETPIDHHKNEFIRLL